MINKIVKIFTNVQSYSFLTYASLIICIISGIFLAIPYDYNNAYNSIAEMLLKNQPAVFFRSIHYWSAQLTLILVTIHIFTHLYKKYEIKLKKGVWIRLAISILFLFYLMLSGFLLIADSNALQARNIFTGLLNTMPLFNRFLISILLGIGTSLKIIFINHIATATLFVLFTTYEHSKVIIPKARYFLYSSFLILILTLFMVPGLHTQNNLIIKGPWYFLGIQETLHWLTHPNQLIIALLIFFILFLSIPYFKIKISNKIKLSLLFIFSFYIFLTIIGNFFRAENWDFKPFWNTNNITNTEFLSFKTFFPISDSLQYKKTPEVLGHKEGCLVCHTKTTGLTSSHNPEAIGCSSCHLGNPFSLNKSLAHKKMVLIPGNLSSAKKTCGQSQCHNIIIDRVNKSLMNTMSGIVSVDKYIFKENSNLNNHFKIQDIKESSGDKHLRNLCASCHLSAGKNKYGKINELSRGGGCNACHLKYSSIAENQLKRFMETKKLNNDTLAHPKLTIKIDNSHCFGCHSRSGRISTSYEGWHETKLTSDEININDTNYRLLQDKRVFIKKLSDVHFDKGMSCIDCHTSYEIMGDNNNYSHKEQQVKILCEDCHLKEKAKTKTIDFSDIDLETQKIIELRKYDTSSKFLVSKSGMVLPNVYLSDNGQIVLISKINNKLLYPKKTISQCGTDIKEHKKLSCKSCHNSWSPQCLGCHTEYKKNEIGFDNLLQKKVKGTWVESDGIYLAEPPVLGIHNKNNEEIVETFVPGMIMTLQRNKTKNLFYRLYAPAFSHTIRTKVRNCKSCHFNSLAIGYGRGELVFNSKNHNAKLSFIPKYRRLPQDKLPEDAWIPFLKKSNSKFNSTRLYYRPFSKYEQVKILRVGICLNCHNEKDKKIIKIFRNFKDYKNHLSPNCILPDFK